MRQIALFLSLLLLAPLAHLAAQEASPLAPGARVRVSLSESHLDPITRSWDQVRWEGTLVALNADTLVLRDRGQGGPLAIPLAHLKKLEVSRGQTSRSEEIGKGAIYGLLTGAAMGAMVTFAVGRSGNENVYWPIMIPPLAGLGLLTGTAIGALHSTERWEQVPLERIRVGVAPQRGGGVRLAASFAF